MKVLALTTSSARGGVALAEGGVVVAEHAYEDEMRHAERVFEAVDRVLELAGARRQDIGLVACDVGPGSFTGVRVGVASASGIARGLGLPVAGVLSLEAMARAAFAASGAERVAALLDARRGEVFLAAYARSGELLLEPCHVAAGTAAALLEPLGPIVACGRIASREGVGDVIDHPSCELPSAGWIAKLARADGASRAAPEVVYLRPPDARLPTQGS
jgi:tRNA threonylcarbamoyladenosine biosynthesis protein TsaB